MKFLFLLVLISLSFNSISCSQDVTWTANIGNNTPSFDLKSFCDSHLKCGTTWSHKTTNFSTQLLNSWITFDSYVSNDQTTIDIKKIVNDKKWYTQNFTIIVSCFFKQSSQSSTEFIKLYINVVGAGDIKTGKILCSNKPFVFSDLITYENPINKNSSINFLDGGGYNGLYQPSNGKYNFEYICKVNDLDCFISFQNPIYIPEKTNFSTGGLPTTYLKTANPVLLSTYTNPTGGKPIYSGEGVVIIGSSYYLDPSMVSNRFTNIKVSNNNNGCVTEESVFKINITPVSGMEEQNGKHIYSLMHSIRTFSNDQDSVNTFSENNFAFGFFDSTQTWTFTTNSGGKYSNYEWKAIYRNKLFASGSGLSFSLKPPKLDTLPYSDYNVFPLDTLMKYYEGYNNVSASKCPIRYHGLINPTNSPNIFSSYLYDPVIILMRCQNINGVPSNWRRYFVGMVEFPKVLQNQKYCLDKQLILTTKTSSRPKSNIIRSSKFFIDNKWQSAENDSLVVNYSSLNKVSYIKTYILDSTKVIGKSFITKNDTTFWSPNGQYGAVFSNYYDSIKIINNPKPITYFNLSGLTSVGTAIKSKVSNGFYNSTDFVKWKWSNNPNIFYGDSIYNYLNDIGNYSLNLNIVDTFNCVFDTTFSNNWIVTGVLKIDELASDNSINFYPVPVKDILTIDSKFEIDNVIIYDINGSVLLEDRQKNINMSFLKSGTYFIHLKVNDNLVIKKIQKL